MKKATLINNELHIKFSVPSEDFSIVLSQIKGIPGRRWDATAKEWIAPNTEDNVHFLKLIGFELIGLPADPATPFIIERPRKEVDFTNLPDILRPYQKEAIEFMEAVDWRGFVSLAPRCVDGDAIVSVNRASLTRKRTIKDLYEKFNHINKRSMKWDCAIPTYIRGLTSDGRYGRLLINGVFYSGKKQSYKITTEDGKSLRTSSDHLFLVHDSCGNDSWTKLSDIQVEDTIVVNGIDICCRCGSRDNLITHQNSKYRGWCRHCMAKERQKARGEHKRRISDYDGYVYICDPLYYDHPKYAKNGIAEHKKIHRAENHFKNFTHWSGSDVITIPKYVKVISIEMDDIIDMYDISVVNNTHNFIANGIVVHNCGKSLVSLCGWMLHKEFSPVLVICPASVKINWQREIRKWTKQKSHIITGTTPYKLPDVPFHIINYDILSSWVDSLPQYNYIITDENHRVSHTTLAKTVEGKTVRVPVKCTEAFRKLAKIIPHLALLSGTPITSRIWQLWVGLNSLAPNEFSNEYKFRWRYCDPRHDGYGYVFDGLSNGDELYARLAKFMYRKTREEIFADLPEESHEFVPVEIDMKLYETDLAEFKKWYAKHRDISDEELEEKLSSFASLNYSKKRTAIIEWLTDFCESNEQIVVFAWHRDVVEDLYATFKKKAVIMYGGMSATAKQKAIDDFNAGKKQMFIANIASAKEGITLAGANTVAFVEFPLTPGDLEQSSQRIWLPDKYDKLQYIYFCAVDLEEARIDKLRQRAKILSKALDNKEAEIMVDKVRGMLEQ